MRKLFVLLTVHMRLAKDVRGLSLVGLDYLRSESIGPVPHSSHVYVLGIMDL